MPDGKTIAHGLLTLCMSADLAGNVLRVEQLKQSINYGCLLYTSDAADE